jgi:hypothetical protein
MQTPPNGVTMWCMADIGGQPDKPILLVFCEAHASPPPPSFLPCKRILAGHAESSGRTAKSLDFKLLEFTSRKPYMRPRVRQYPFLEYAI